MTISPSPPIDVSVAVGNVSVVILDDCPLEPRCWLALNVIYRPRGIVADFPFIAKGIPTARNLCSCKGAMVDCVHSTHLLTRRFKMSSGLVSANLNACNVLNRLVACSGMEGDIHHYEDYI